MWPLSIGLSVTGKGRDGIMTRLQKETAMAGVMRMCRISNQTGPEREIGMFWLTTKRVMGVDYYADPNSLEGHDRVWTLSPQLALRDALDNDRAMRVGS